MKKLIKAVGYIAITHIGIVFGMDKEIIRKLDLSKRELPIWRAPSLSWENFDHLVQNNAALLKSLAAVEQGGNYCGQLHRAMAVLHNNSKIVFKKGLLADICDPQTIRFVRLITSRNSDSARLMSALKDSRVEDVHKFFCDR